jgi:replicative DNA helicase
LTSRGADRVSQPRQPDVTGIATGFTDLTATSGLQEGDLIVIAGRPSMGKTSLALNIAEHVALVSRYR